MSHMLLVGTRDKETLWKMWSRYRETRRHGQHPRALWRGAGCSEAMTPPREGAGSKHPELTRLHEDQTQQKAEYEGTVDDIRAG